MATSRPMRMYGVDADGQWQVMVMVPTGIMAGVSAYRLIAKTVRDCRELGDSAQKAVRIATRVSIECCDPMVPEHDVRRIVGYVYGGDRGWM